MKKIGLDHKPVVAANRKKNFATEKDKQRELLRLAEIIDRRLQFNHLLKIKL